MLTFFKCRICCLRSDSICLADSYRTHTSWYICHRQQHKITLMSSTYTLSHCCNQLFQCSVAFCFCSGLLCAELLGFSLFSNSFILNFFVFFTFLFLFNISHVFDFKQTVQFTITSQNFNASHKAPNDCGN